MARVLDENYLAITAIVTVFYQLSFFLVAVTFKFDKVTDFAGGTNFVLLAVLTAVLKGEWDFRQIILTLFVVIWGLRLGVFLLMRILAWGEDRRFDSSRNDVWATAAFWFFQALWVWIVSLPVTIVNATSGAPGVTAADVSGCTMWTVGFVLETVADQQKLSFKKSPESKGTWCAIGLWKYSRHPNYFGEILLWWGVFVASTPVLKGGQWAAILSPLFTMTILLFLSGLPVLEASSDKKFGSREEYKAYKNKTSPLVPLPTSLYGALPFFVKIVFLLELPIYNRERSVIEQNMQTTQGAQQPSA